MKVFFEGLLKGLFFGIACLASVVLTTKANADFPIIPCGTGPACPAMAAWCSLQNGACAPAAGRDPKSCICDGAYAAVGATCGCGDWFP